MTRVMMLLAALGLTSAVMAGGIGAAAAGSGDTPPLTPGISPDKVPAEVLGVRCQAIVAVDVISWGESKEIDVKLAGEEKSAKFKCVKVEAKVFYVLKAGGDLRVPSAQTRPSRESTLPEGAGRLLKPIAISVYVPDPRDAGDAEDVAQYKSSHLGSIPNLKKTKPCVMYLAQADEPKDSYVLVHGFLSDHAPTNLFPLAERANPDNWAWGKAVDGLQVCIMTPRKWMLQADGTALSPNLLVALRNSGTEDQKVNTYNGFPLLKGALAYSRPASAGTKQISIYGDMKNDSPGFNPERDLLTLKPGQVMFLSDRGPDGRYIMLKPGNIPDGTAKLTVTYTSQGMKDAKDKYWTGSVDGTADIVIEKMPAPKPPVANPPANNPSGRKPPVSLPPVGRPVGNPMPKPPMGGPGGGGPMRL